MDSSGVWKLLLSCCTSSSRSRFSTGNHWGRVDRIQVSIPVPDQEFVLIPDQGCCVVYSQKCCISAQISLSCELKCASLLCSGLCIGKAQTNLDSFPGSIQWELHSSAVGVNLLRDCLSCIGTCRPALISILSLDRRVSGAAQKVGYPTITATVVAAELLSDPPPPRHKGYIAWSYSSWLAGCASSLTVFK